MSDETDYLYHLKPTKKGWKIETDFADFYIYLVPKQMGRIGAFPIRVVGRRKKKKEKG